MSKKYKSVCKPNHPMANSKGYILEHRYIMSNYMGRSLDTEEIVHHKNGDTLDNSIENLQIVDRSTHIKIHRKDMVKSKNYCFIKTAKTCKQCGEKYNKSGKYFCSKECLNKSKIGKKPKNMSGLELGWSWWKGKTHNHTPKGKEHWNYIERPKLVCEWCDSVYKNIRKRKTRRFCSSECRYKWASHRMKTQNPMFNRGK